jgi:hypothetical protein
VVLLGQFIDFDRCDNIFYNNLYLEDYKIVVKMPFVDYRKSKADIKVEKFDLVNKVYLLSYD